MRSVSKGNLLVSSPMKRWGFLDEALKWTCKCGVVLDESSVVASRTEKGVEFFGRHGYGPGYEASNFGWTPAGEMIIITQYCYITDGISKV